MNRRPVIQKLPAFAGRTIVISDIHGSLDVYEKLLKKVNYIPGEDRLILLGDLVEKGTQNLALLRRIMKQCKDPEVYAVMGNCDFVAKNVLYNYRLDYLNKVLHFRKNSLIHEMIAEAGLPPLTRKTDMPGLAQELRSRYLPELSFLNDLPHVIVTPDIIFAHSGISNEVTFGDDFKEIMVRFQFAKEEHSFSRMVVVGHMPVSEYSTSIADFNPLFNAAKNIYSIDGGNAVNQAGQLNALIIHRGLMQQVHTDLLPKVRVLHTTHPKNSRPVFLGYANSEAEILHAGAEQSLIHAPSLKRDLLVDNDFLKDGKAYNYTSYALPLIAGQTVHLVRIGPKKAQVKHHGVMGWTALENLDLQNADLSGLPE